MKNNLLNKNFGVLGLGISNHAVVEYFIINNYNFIIWDDNSLSLSTLAKELQTKYNFDIQHCVKSPEEPDWLNIDYLVMSPGIPLSHPKPHKIASLAQKQRINIICDIELFYLLHPNNTYIGITGTNGKSTITALTYHIINNHTNNALIAGNIGKPIFYLQNPQDKIIILEISSYQIDLLNEIRFAASALSNITPDHIDRHGSFNNYINIKFKLISELTNGTSIINIDSSITNDLYKNLARTKHSTIPTSTSTHLKNGVSLIKQTIHDNIHNKVIPIPTNNFLLGQHNAQNITIAFALASSIIPIQESVIQSSISSFVGLEHRMQFINKRKNISFINDSKGTNAVSTLYALEGCKNIYWILGGLPKEDGIEPLIPYFNNVLHAFTIGQAKDDFATVLNKYKISCKISTDLKQAFKDAVEKAKNEDKEITILLSPACASFDQWKNFEERGDAFIKLVEDFIREND